MRLTMRQIGLAACLLEGMSEKESARAIGASHDVVRYNLRQMRLKLGARNTRHLIAILAAMA